MGPPVRSQLCAVNPLAIEMAVPRERTTWLDRFHAGDRRILDEVYRRHVDTVHRAAASVLGGADLETVVHELFFRVITSGDLRRAFRGGDLGAWLVVIARHHAIDYVRRRQREHPAGLEVAAGSDGERHDAAAADAEAAMVIRKFCDEVLPEKWRPVFEARFLQNLTQTEAAAALRVRRTTLVYQELRIRHLLRAFLLEDTP